MSRTIFLPILLFLIFVSGCKPSSTPEPLKTSTLESPTSNLPPIREWTIIKLTHSGGIAGVMRFIEISSDGNYTVTDERTNKTVTKQLPTNELSKLQEIVSNLESISTDKPVPSVCADCFIYNLEIQRDGKKNFSAQVDDISMRNSGMETLITYLRGLIDEAVK